jgi:nitronate monooxygenase
MTRSDADRQSPMTLTALHTAACDLMGCEYPVFLAGMGGVARAELVTAVSEAGGYGFLGMVREPPEFIRAQIRAVRERTGRPFGVNLIPAATPVALLREQVAVCLAERVDAVCLFWDVAPELVAHLRDAGIITVVQVGSVGEARRAVAAGAQMIVVQSVRAGGHVRGRVDWREILPDVVSRCDVPIVAAGGIVDGAGLAEAVSLGADGAMLGTAFLATDESFAHAYHKRRIVDSRAGDTVYTDAFHINWPAGAPVRVLANSVTRGEWGHPYQEPRVEIGTDDGRPIFVFSTDSPLKSTEGELEAMAIYAGEGAARVDRVVPAAERMASIMAQASDLLHVSSSAVADMQSEAASKVCFADEADDLYMGYAPRDELLAAIDSFLAVKRGSARAAIRLATTLRRKTARKLMNRVYDDDAASCRALSEAIMLLGGTPSRDVDGLYEAVMALDTMTEKLSAIRKTQCSVIENARQLLPRVRNDRIYECLAEIIRRPVLAQDDIDRLSCSEATE